jgi:hypothetical protein
MATTPEPPKLTKPKLSSFERRGLNNALEPIQEWVKANHDALYAQAHTQIDRLAQTIREQADKAAAALHTQTDKTLDWATTQLAELKF